MRSTEYRLTHAAGRGKAASLMRATWAIQFSESRGNIAMSIPEGFDNEKIAEAALAILSLSRMSDQYGVTAWKGIDWDVMNLLFEKGWISDPVGKQKSVGVSEEGINLADQFLEKYFGKQTKSSTL
jgi:hypothetical protein